MNTSRTAGPAAIVNKTTSPIPKAVEILYQCCGLQYAHRNVIHSLKANNIMLTLTTA
jgi:hypothetical protein